MFGVLGEIVFATASGPEMLRSTRSWAYAEHRVLETTPQLQWTGADLEILSLEMMFHASFTNPASELNALIGAGDDRVARPLVMGNGDHRGYFIVTSVDTTMKQMSDTGDVISAIAQVQLKQYSVGSGSAAAFGISALLSGIAVVPSNTAGQPSISAPTTVNPGSALYSALTTQVPGISPVLNVPQPVGAYSALTAAADVPTSSIVRAGSL